jgi:hypothetical protein
MSASIAETVLGRQEMLQNLIDRTRSEEIVEPEGLVVGFDRVQDVVTLRLQLSDAETTAPLELWRVVCAGFEEFVVRPEPGRIAAFNKTHAAVRQYVDSHAEIFFAGPAATPGQTADRLRAAHQRIASDWIPFERYMNEISTADLLGRAGGKIFSGPLFIALEVERILREAGVTTTRFPEDVSGGPPSASSLEMLVVGRSHIIAAEFEATRVDPTVDAAQPAVAADGASPRR